MKTIITIASKEGKSLFEIMSTPCEGAQVVDCEKVSYKELSKINFDEVVVFENMENAPLFVLEKINRIYHKIEEGKKKMDPRSAYVIVNDVVMRKGSARTKEGWKVIGEMLAQSHMRKNIVVPDCRGCSERPHGCELSCGGKMCLKRSVDGKQKKKK